MRSWKLLHTHTLRSVCCCALAVLVVAGPAHASPDTLRTSLENMLWAPFDIVAAPVNGGIAVRRDLPYAGESTAQRAAYVPAAFLGFTVLHLLAGGLRAVSGVLQFPAGLALFPFPHTDLPQQLDPLGEGDPLVGWKNPLGESPVRYVLPVTPLTIDVGIGLLSPVVLYDRDVERREPSAGRGAGRMKEETAP